MRMDIRFKKCDISNWSDVCIFDDPCLSKFGALRGSCPHPGRQFVGLLCPIRVARRKSCGSSGSLASKTAVMNARLSPLPHKTLHLQVFAGTPIQETDFGECRDKCTFYASVAQSVEQGTENPRVIGSIPIGGTSQETQQGFQYAAVAHLVERHLAKVEVASSSLVGRSNRSEIGRASCRERV